MFRTLYQRELDRLWSRLGAIGKRVERAAPLFARDADPRVARVLQHAACYFARVTERLEDDMPELIAPVVGAVMPEVLRPTPSATIVSFGMGSPEGPALIAARAELTSRPVAGKTCTFITRWPATVCAFTPAVGRLERRSADEQLLHLRFRATAAGPGSIVPARLRLYFDLGEPAVTLDLIHAICSANLPIVARVHGGDGREVRSVQLPASTVHRPAFGAEARLYPGRADAYESSSLLRELFTFPETFAFVDLDLAGLDLPEGAAVPAFSLTLPLASWLPGARHFSEAHVHLGCTPAVNSFVATTREQRIAGVPQRYPLEFSAAGSQGPIVLEVNELVVDPGHGEERARSLVSWEDVYARRAIDSDVLFYRLHRRPDVVREDAVWEVSFATRVAQDVVPTGESFVAEVLAGDGARTRALLANDIRRDLAGREGRNIGRVSPPIRLLLGREIPWRLNAYARMSGATLGSEEGYLAAFVALHDLPRLARGSRREALHLAHPGIARASHSRTHRLDDEGDLQHGDAIDIGIDAEAFGGPGYAAVLSEILARAVAERTSLVRYCRTKVSGSGLAFDGGVREGRRLPAPFG